MADGFFGYGEVNEFRPDYGGVDWRKAYERRMEKLGRELPRPAWFEAEDKDGQITEQLTQETFTIYRNATNPDMDIITVLDPRDGAQIIWSRADLGNEEFKKIYDAHVTEALMVVSKYPLKMVVEYIMARAGVDITKIEEEGLPDGWNEPS